eukprot:7606918-Pyramimonas_sp.AAC.1
MHISFGPLPGGDLDARTDVANPIAVHRRPSPTDGPRWVAQTNRPPPYPHPRPAPSYFLAPPCKILGP